MFFQVCCFEQQNTIWERNVSLKPACANIGKLIEITCLNFLFKKVMKNFPGGPVVQNLPANAGETSSMPGLGGFTCPGAAKPMCHNYRACAP